MPLAASSRPSLEDARDGWWWLRPWASRSVMAAISDRRAASSRLPPGLPSPQATVAAEQVHGASLAAVWSRSSIAAVPGCDALLTNVPGIALVVRSADCLPIFFADAARGVVGLAHAGWRGLSAWLPSRVIAALQQLYHSRPEDLQVAIGPAIRACCYEVGPEFRARFGAYVQERRGRRTCDLIGVAADQLRRCGVSPARIVDLQQCTVCEAQRWCSLRREGQTAGRMTSMIMVRP